MSDSVEVAEDRSRLERAPPGDKFPDPIGTLGEADRTAENLKAMRFPYRMYTKALKHTGGIEEVRCCVWFEAIVRLTACILFPLAHLLASVVLLTGVRGLHHGQLQPAAGVLEAAVRPQAEIRHIRSHVPNGLVVVCSGLPRSAGKETRSHPRPALINSRTWLRLESSTGRTACMSCTHMQSG